MRARLDDNHASGLFITDLFRMKTAKMTTPPNNLQLSDNMAPVQLFDCNSGGSKNILLPAITDANREAVWYIGNVGASNNVVVKTTDGLTTVATIAISTSAMIFNDGTTYYAFVFSNALAGAFVKTAVLTMPMNLADLVNSATWKLAVPFDFTLNSVGLRIGKPATTGSKLATLSAQISGTPCTGGVISATSATATPTGALIAGTAITALNTGSAGDTIEVAISSVTSFVEGNGWAEFKVTAR